MRRREQDRLHELLLAWYDRSGRPLPWRRTRNPYRILISEVMLQQTQVTRVLIKYPLFLQRFPDFKTLARARRRSVILAWQGMGYNNRAVRLQELARRICSDHGGLLPENYAALIALPGVGRYTANALLSSAFRQPVPIVDTNVHRVLSRLKSRLNSVTDRNPLPGTWRTAEEFLPESRSYEWNQALMDLGATVCTATSPACPECPLGPVCASAGLLGPPQRKRQRAEPSFRGTPNRIYRGRIVEILREEPVVRVAGLARLLHPGVRSTDLRWLDRLIDSLETDGLVRTSGRPGSRQRRVQLA